MHKKIISSKKSLGLIAVLLFAISAIFFFYTSVPIQPDEINTRVYNSRFIVQDYIYTTFQLLCLPNGQTLSWSIWPIAIINAFFLKNDGVIWFRIVPIVGQFLAPAALFYYAVQRGVSSKNSIIVGSILLFITFSTASSVWAVTQRSEYMFITLLSLITILFSLRSNINKNVAVVFTAIISLMWICVSYIHPKSLYLLPLIVYVGWLNINALSIKIIFFAILSYYGLLLSEVDYQRIISCLYNPELQGWMENMNLNVLKLLSSPLDYIDQFVLHWNSQWINLFSRAPNNLTYFLTPDIGHMPSVKQDGFLVNITNHVIKTTYFTLLITYPFLILMNTIFLVKSISKKSIDQNLLFSLILGVPIGIIILNNRTTNAYDIQFWVQYLCTYALIFMLSIKMSTIDSFVKCIYIYAFIAILLNIFTYKVYFYNVFKTTWATSSFAGPGVPLRFVEKEYILKIRSKFMETIEVQDFDIALVDDRTYIPLENFKNVYPVTYAMQSAYFGKEINNGKLSLVQFLDKYDKVIFFGSCDFRAELPAFFNDGKIIDDNLCMMWKNK